MSRRLPVAPGTLSAGRRVVTGDDYRYLFRALRLAVGDALELFDGAGWCAEAQVIAVSAERAELEVAAPRPATAEPALVVTALIALIKGERLDWCVQKLTELGVSRVVPVQAARSVVKLAGDRAHKRHQRLESIARDAARQCGRAAVPVIESVSPLAPALAACDAALRLVLDESDRRLGLRERLAGGRFGSIALLVGPEGGFAPEELSAAHSAGFESVGLGPRILRAETAAIAAVAAVLFACGDLGQAI